jgi:hypothetical protein
MGSKTMRTPNEFWLALHALAQAYHMEGSTSEERLENIVEEFRELPPAVRRSVLGELGQIAAHASDLYVATLLAAGERDVRESLPPRAAAG